ncbi:MAG TPA: hypothetical protein VLH35_03585 [Candidatus Acidoferrales bacterium]|nr:hypothetical protein [Candidatus Acidoferrales bacterium]
MKNDPLCVKEDVCDMAVCDGVSGRSHAVLKSAVLVQQSTNKQSIKLPKEAVENIVECISNQRDIPVEFKAVLVNNFWDLL